MSALNRKLRRDLLQMKGQSLAIIAVMACGVATFVMSLTTLRSLEQSQASYYEQFRFADVFAHVKRAPEALSARVAEIAGVAAVQTRIVADVTLDVPGMAEPATGRLVSVPEAGRPRLNDLYLREGRYIEPNRAGEAMVSEAFALANSLRPGDRVNAIINGRLQSLRIVGIALSPEYVLAIESGQSLPDERRFGIFWMGREELENAFDMEGAFNDLTLRLTRGASEEEVIRRLDRLLDPYGSVGAYGRADQISHRFLSDEIRSLRGMGLIVPIIFLAVAAFLLNVVMSRLIATQREQVAALKAFGYSNLEVGWHYLKFVLVIALIGAAIGTTLGVWLAGGLTQLYARFYKFPTFIFEVDLRIALAGLGTASGAAIAGTLASVRRAVILPAAQAMRPEPPADYRPTTVERLGLQRFFTQPARMVLRQLERRPVKAGLSILGISMAVAVLVLGRFLTDALDYVIEFAFHAQQRHDVMISFVEPTSWAAFYEAQRLPDVIHAEPMRAVSVRFHNGHITRRSGINGLAPDGRLMRVIDTAMRPVPLPPEGLIMSDKLAEVMQVSPGQVVRVEVMEGERVVRDVRLAAVVREFAGTNAYMDIAALHRLLQEGDTLTGALLSVDGRRLDELYRALKQTPWVAGVSVKEATVRSFNETQAQNQRTIQAFNIAFAMVIAAGVVYNTARISLAERGRELATLRVIGFTRGEISSILLGELAVLTITALPVGMALGYGFAWLATLAFDSESFRVPLVVSKASYGFAATVVLLAAVVSGLLVRRRLDQLDLVSVLKSTE